MLKAVMLNGFDGAVLYGTLWSVFCYLRYGKQVLNEQHDTQCKLVVLESR